MVERSIFILAGILIGLAPVRADESALPLCPGASKVAAADPLLRDAFRAAYPRNVERKGRARPSEPCIYPYQAILYESSVVLITLGDIPGEGCHGCGAKVSAAFLKRDGATLAPVGRHRDFAETGTFASPMAVTPIRLGTDDGVVVEGGGTFQGVSFSVMEVFVFRNGRATSIGPEKGIPLAFEDCGAKIDEPCDSIGGAWRVDPGGRLIVTYRGLRADKAADLGTVVYERKGDGLVLVAGEKAAAEMNELRP